MAIVRVELSDVLFDPVAGRVILKGTFEGNPMEGWLSCESIPSRVEFRVLLNAFVRENIEGLRMGAVRCTSLEAGYDVEVDDA